MSDGLQKTLYTTHRAIQDKHVYFLLAAAGASIGFAITRTNDAALHWAQVPLGLAVLCWGLSFYYGCRNVDFTSETVFVNTELLRIRSGQHPMAGVHPQAMAVGAEVALKAIDRNSNAAGNALRWQFRLLLLGAVLFVVWHVGEMYLRRSSALPLFV